MFGLRRPSALLEVGPHPLCQDDRAQDERTGGEPDQEWQDGPGCQGTDRQGGRNQLVAMMSLLPDFGLEVQISHAPLACVERSEG